MTTDPHPTVARFVSADERQDAETIGTLLTDDCTLISPITDAFRFEGRRSVEAVYASAFDILESSFRRPYTSVSSSPLWPACSSNQRMRSDTFVF